MSENITPYGYIFSAFEKFNVLPRAEQQYILEEAVARKEHLHQTTELVLADDGDWEIVHNGYRPVVPDEMIILPFVYGSTNLDMFMDVLTNSFLISLRKHLQEQRNRKEQTNA